MTDNEIIKALEYCINNNGICEDCPLLNKMNSSKECTDEMIRGALTIINRQKAEIERLKEITESPILGKLVHVWKNEAIVSFAEKLKANMVQIRLGGHKHNVITENGIDYYVKETVGEDNGRENF